MVTDAGKVSDLTNPVLSHDFGSKPAELIHEYLGYKVDDYPHVDIVETDV